MSCLLGLSARRRQRAGPLPCPAVAGYLKRLLTTAAAYQVADVVAKVLALALLPLYTRALTPADYGTAELLLTLVIVASIVVRLGVGEAFVRLYYDDDDPARRDRLARAATGYLMGATTAVAFVLAVFADPLSRLVLGYEDGGTFRIAVLGLWAFTNLELANALLRVDERWREYAVAALANVILTVSLTVTLVVILDQGVRGYLLGNFGASVVIVLALWWRLRGRLGLPLGGLVRAELPGMLRFGLPTVPAEVSVFALNVIDRAWLYRTESEAAAGLYSLSIKLAAVVIFTVRAFQYAWPPLAYSIHDDAEARRLYAFVTTYYVLATGLIVAALTLLGRWAIRLLAAPDFQGAFAALPWVSLGWALYGLFLVQVVIAGRARVTTRNFPAALCGLAANVAALILLVPPFGIAGAGAALCVAYVVMIGVMHVLTRGLFAVGFQWARLAQVLLVVGGVTLAAELLLPTAGAAGFVLRLLALAVIPALLWLTGFVRPEERTRLGMLARAVRLRLGGPQPNVNA